MAGWKQLDFGFGAAEGRGGAGTGKDASGAGDGARGALAGLRGGCPGAGGAAGNASARLRAGEGDGKKGRYVAVIYREEDDGRGNLVLKKVTTSRYVTVGQIAASLGVSDQSIYQRVQSGEFDGGPLPVDRVGSAIRIPVDTFLRWKERYVTGAEYERPEKEER